MFADWSCTGPVDNRTSNLEQKFMKSLLIKYYEFQANFQKFPSPNI